MSESRGPGSLRVAAIASVTLLVAGVSGLVVRAEVLQWGWYWRAYRTNVREHAEFVARDLAHHLQVSAQLAAPPPRPVFTAQFATTQAMPSLAVLAIGLMALVLASHGHRVAWLPLAGALTLLDDPGTIIDGYGGWTTASGRAVDVAVVAAAVTPLLVALRRRSGTGHGVPVARAVRARVLVLAALVAGLPAVIVYAGPTNDNVPRPVAAAALLGYGVLIVTSSLRRRWLAAALVLPALAIPSVGWSLAYNSDPGSESTAALVVVGLLAYVAVACAVRPPRRWMPVVVALPLAVVPQLTAAMSGSGDGFTPTYPSFTGPLLVALALVAFGAAVPLSGHRLLAAWSTALRRGPLLRRPMEPAGS